MKKIFLISVVLASVNVLVAQEIKYGALAIDKSNGFYYGWAYDYGSLSEAVDRALLECEKKGGDCHVVVEWSGEGCAAYRTISGEVGSAYGWGIAATKEAADVIATREALKRSNGVTPSNYVWACNSSGSGVLKILKNEIPGANTKLTGLKDQLGDIFSYEGEVLNNLPHGIGKATYDNGATYSGNYVNGKKEGKGTFNFKNGSRYDGYWKGDKVHGKGIQQFASGSRYEGDYVEGIMEGKGTYTFASGNRYEGELKNDKMHGYGIWHDKDGGYYEGDYVNGLMHGYGKYTDAQGNVLYEGRMVNDERAPE